MGKCRIVLVRHGQSEGNFVRAFLGHTDLPLTELGHRQAEATAKYVERYNIDMLYASDLKRAWQTAEHIAEHNQLSIIADQKLREIYAGEWEGRYVEDLAKEFSDDYSVWLNDIGNSRCTAGESFRGLYSRIICEVQRIAELNEGLTVCIATHATPIRCVRLKTHGYDFDRAKELGWTCNASVTVVDVENGEFSFVDEHHYEHLGDIVTGLPRNI